jgi:DNA-binding transcriptional LysR family regulator
MVKAGLGIGLLGSYVVREPTAVPLDLDVHVSVPIYAFALAQRLNARPVRLVYDWMSEFWSGNPWFGNEFRLDCGPSRHDVGMKLLFNL